MGENYTESAHTNNNPCQLYFLLLFQPPPLLETGCEEVIEFASGGRGAQIHKLMRRFIDLKMYYIASEAA